MSLNDSSGLRYSVGMKLPEKELSFWTDNSPKTSYPSLNEELTVDVAVVGGGIGGLSAAYQLKKAGLTVAVIEKDRVGGGTTGGTTGKVTSQHGQVYAQLQDRLGKDSAKIYGQSNEQAISIIEGIIKTEKIECDWARDDHLLYSADPDKVQDLKDEAKVARNLGLPASFETDSDLPFPIKGVVRFANQAKFNARKYVIGLAKAVEGNGSRVFEKTRAIGIRDGSPGRVRSSGGAIITKHIIVATNVPCFPLIARGAYCASEYPQKSYIAAGYISGLRGMYISPDSAHYSLMPIQVKGRTLLLVGGESHIPGTRLNFESRYERLADYGAKHFGMEPAYRWHARDYLAYDDIPLVGKAYPWSKNLYVTTAYRKWGLTNSTVSAIILRDRITGRKNEWVKTYNSLRTSAPLSFPKVVGEKLGIK